MKQAFWLLLLCTSLQLSAQQLDEKATGSETKKEETGSENKLNIFKVNISALPFKNFSFQYERVLQKKISVALGIRFMPNGSIPMKESLKNATDGDPDAIKVIDNAQVGNFAITPEFRFYPGKHGYGRGFYLAPYYRYAKFTGEGVPIEFVASGGGTKTINLSGDLSTHTGGLMLGVQFYLGKSVSLDWWILGAQYGGAKGTFVGTPSSPLTPTEQDEIRKTIQDFKLPVGKITSEVNASSVKAIFDGTWAGVRGGITLGIRF